MLYFSFSFGDKIINNNYIIANGEKELTQFMMMGTFMYFLCFIWLIGDIILGIIVLCTRPK